MRSLFFGLLSRLLAGVLRLARVCSKKALQLLFGFILNPVQGSELRLARLTKCEGYRRALYDPELAFRHATPTWQIKSAESNQHALALRVSCAQSRSVSPREKAGAGHRERKQERGTADAG